MDAQSRPENTEPTLFSAIITPHRSLSVTGFMVVMGLVGVVSFAAGLFFFILGAWPVIGFFGLDVLLIYWAFRLNYRSAAAFEQVTVTPSELRLRRVTHRGEVSEWTLNPVWISLDRERHEDFGLLHLFLVSQGRKLPVAGFLSPPERESFAAALSSAISIAKRGAPRTVAV